MRSAQVGRRVGGLEALGAARAEAEAAGNLVAVDRAGSIVRAMAWVSGLSSASRRTPISQNGRVVLSERLALAGTVREQDVSYSVRHGRAVVGSALVSVTAAGAAAATAAAGVCRRRARARRSRRFGGGGERLRRGRTGRLRSLRVSVAGPARAWVAGCQDHRAPPRLVEEGELRKARAGSAIGGSWEDRAP
jgi:hypothetical protein